MLGNCAEKTGNKPIETVQMSIRDFFKAFPNILENSVPINISNEKLRDYVDVMIAEGGNPDVVLLAQGVDGVTYGVTRIHWLYAAHEVLTNHVDFANTTNVRAVIVKNLSNDAIRKLISIANEGGGLEPRSIFARAFIDGVLLPIIKCIASINNEDVTAFIRDVLTMDVKAQLTKEFLKYLMPYARLLDPKAMEKEVLQYTYAILKTNRTREELMKTSPGFVKLIEEVENEVMKESQEEIVSEENPTKSRGNEEGTTVVKTEVVSEAQVPESPQSQVQVITRESPKDKRGEAPTPVINANAKAVTPTIPSGNVVKKPIEVNPDDLYKELYKIDIDGKVATIRDITILYVLDELTKAAKAFPWGKGVPPHAFARGMLLPLRPLAQAVKYGLSFSKPGSAIVFDSCRDAIIGLITLAKLDSDTAVVRQLIEARVLSKLEDCISQYYRFSTGGTRAK